MLPYKKITEEENIKTLKVEIINLPVKKIEWLPIILAILAFGVSLSSLLWSYHTYRQLLPLQQANIIVLESSNITHSDSEHPIISDGMVTSYDEIGPIIKNIGKSSAKNIKFMIYAVYFDESLKFQTSSSSIERFYKEELMHELGPDAVTSFGFINLPHFAESCNRNLVGERQQVALIFTLQYNDSLIKISEPFTKIFLYQYPSDGGKLYSLTKTDFEKYKIRERFIKWLDDKGEKDEEKLLDYIKKI